MADFHFDTSALVKYYVLEPGSTWVPSAFNAVDAHSSQAAYTVSIADVTIAETPAAFAVLYRTGRIRRAAWLGAFDLFMADLTQRWLVVDTTDRCMEI